MATLKEFMDEKKLVSRWTVLRVGIIGVFAGAIITFIFLLAGLV